MEFQRLAPCFRGQAIYPTRSTGVLDDETGSGKSNMAACKQEVHISQRVDVIETKFQRVYLCFRGQAIQRDQRKCHTSGEPQVTLGFRIPMNGWTALGASFTRQSY